MKKAKIQCKKQKWIPHRVWNDRCEVYPIRWPDPSLSFRMTEKWCAVDALPLIKERWGKPHPTIYLMGQAENNTRELKRQRKKGKR
jgi:hypothetical protein